MTVVRHETKATGLAVYHFGKSTSVVQTRWPPHPTTHRLPTIPVGTPIRQSKSSWCVLVIAGSSGCVWNSRLREVNPQRKAVVPPYSELVEAVTAPVHSAIMFKVVARPALNPNSKSGYSMNRLAVFRWNPAGTLFCHDLGECLFAWWP